MARLSPLRIACIALFALLVTRTQAQTVVWSMPPSDYDEILRLGNNLFKVTLNGMIGLIMPDGTVIEKPDNDEIIGYYEDKALLVKKDSYGERIVGCLTSEGRYYKFPKPYYTLNGQKFYSEGMLSVENEDGKKGYVDIRGDEVLGFGSYTKIKPFVEDHAVVFKGQKSFLIDKNGKPTQFIFPKIAEVGAITNLYEGIAYVWDDLGGAYIYDVSKDEKTSLKKTKNPESDKSDFLYRLSCLTGKGKDVPFVDVVNHGEYGLTATENDGLFGYFSEEYPVLPYQTLFSASQFEDGFAVVGIYGKLGILKIEPGYFSLSLLKDKFDFHQGESVSCSFSLSMPSVWTDKTTLTLQDDSGIAVAFEKSGDTYTFKVVPNSTSSRHFNISVYGDGLTLYKTSFDCSFIKKEICPTCGKDIDKCEFNGSHPKEKKLNDYIHH